MEAWRTIPGKYVVYRATSIFFGHFFLQSVDGKNEVQLNDADIQYPWSVENLFLYSGTSPGYAVKVRYGDYTASYLDAIENLGRVSTGGSPTVWNTAQTVVKDVASGKTFDEPAKAIQMVALVALVGMGIFYFYRR